MPLKKSCFKPSLFLYTLRRFSPIWVCASLGLLLIPFELYNVSLYDNQSPYTIAINLNDAILNLTVAPSYLFSFCYAVVVAMALFSYLYTSKSALGTHALPLSRSTLFFTHLLTGYAMMLLPLAVLFAVTAPLLWALGAPSAIAALLQFCFATFGTFVFFFSFAVFCGMFTGQLWGLPLFYVIFNAIVYLTFMLFHLLCDTFLFGFYSRYSSDTFVCSFTPLWRFASVLYQNIDADTGNLVLNSSALPTVARYAFIGILFALAAFAIFRKRHLETAGEIVAVGIMRPIFALCCAVYGGIICMTFIYQLFSYISGFWVFFWLFFGVFFGFFIAQMLLQKTIAVFTKRAFLQSTVLFCIFALAVSGVYFDLLGYHTYVPDISDIESVSVQSYHSLAADNLTFSSASITTHDASDITLVTSMHSAFIADFDAEDCTANDYFTVSPSRRNERMDILSEEELAALASPVNLLGEGYDITSSNTSRVTIDYTLTSGQVISRVYYIHLSASEIVCEGAPAYYFEQLMAQNTDITAELSTLRDGISIEIYDKESVEWVALSAGNALAGEIVDAIIADLTARGAQTSLLQKEYDIDTDLSIRGFYEGKSIPEIALTTYFSLQVRTGTALYDILAENNLL